MEAEGHGNPYIVGLKDGEAYSPATSPWGVVFLAYGGGAFRTFDDGGWQHWALEFVGLDYQGFIKATVEFGSGTWTINPVAWSPARLAEGHPVGVCLYSGYVLRGTLPSGYFADQRSFYHAVTIWEINAAAGTMVITDSDDQLYGPRTVDYIYGSNDIYGGNDWVILDLYPGSDAHINYAVCLAGSTGTVSADIVCTPSFGTLPFITQMTATLTNNFTGTARRLAGLINLTLANGFYQANWKSGHATVAPGGSQAYSWNQFIPHWMSTTGTNICELVAEDVTPAPYNQPPYPPSGDTDDDSCAVMGIAP